MAKWIFNGTLHLLFERWKIEVEAASQLIKGYPLQFGLVTRLRDLRSIPSGQRVKQRIDIRKKKKKKEDRGEKKRKRNVEDARTRFFSGSWKFLSPGQQTDDEEEEERTEGEIGEGVGKENVEPFNHGTRSRAFRGSAFILPILRGLIDHPVGTQSLRDPLCRVTFALLKTKSASEPAWKTELNFIAACYRRWHENISGEPRGLECPVLAQVFVSPFRILYVLAVLRVSDRLGDRNYFSLSEFNYARCFARNMFPGQRSILRVSKQWCKWEKDVRYDMYNPKRDIVRNTLVSTGFRIIPLETNSTR